MKRLSTTPINDSAQFFPKRGTLEFLQDANKEAFAATIIALIGPSYNPSTVYVLYGVVNSGTYPVYTTTAGAIFYNGEVFNMDAFSFTATGSNVAVFSIVTTQFVTDADPVTLSDTTTHNIHNIRKMQITDAASGSGLADILSAFFLSFAIPAQLVLTATGQAVRSGTYPNWNIDVPLATNLNPVLFAGSFNIGAAGGIFPAGLDYSVTFAAISTASYYVMGTMISNGTPDVDSCCIWTIRSRTTTGFTLHVHKTLNVTTNIAFEFILFKQ